MEIDPASNLKPNFTWDDASFAKVKQFHDDGFSASDIARLMGQGLTRNSIIGILHRRGVTRLVPRMKPKPKPIPPKRPPVAAKHDGGQRTGASRSQMKAMRPKVAPMVMEGAVDFEPIEPDTSSLRSETFTTPLPGSEPVPLLLVTRCKCAVADKPVRFCNEPTVEGSSYCPTHKARFYKARET